MVSKFDSDNAYRQLPLSREARNLCIFAVTNGNLTGYHRFLESFYSLADIRTILQEKMDQTLEHKHPAWLDDLVVVTKVSKEEHKKELIDVLTRLENVGCRFSETKSKISQTGIDWMCHQIDQAGIRPLQPKDWQLKKLNNQEVKRN